MVRIDLIDNARNLKYERKMPAPQAYFQPAPVKLTSNRCLKALFGFGSFSVISLALAADRILSGEEFLIAAILAYTGFSNLVRVVAIWRIYIRVRRGESIYVQSQTRRPVSPAASVAAALIITALGLLASLFLLGLILATDVSLLIRVVAGLIGVVLWSAVFQSWKRVLGQKY